MPDIALAFDTRHLRGDLVADASGELAQKDDLQSAVVISLFTWRRAEPDDELPARDGDRKGWWGDSFAEVEGDRIGSRLWLLAREKITPETIARAKAYIEEALAWLVADGVASRVEVRVERLLERDLTTVGASIRIVRVAGGQGGGAVDLRFDDLWASLGA